MQLEEQDTEEQHEDENIFLNDGQNNKESDIRTESLQRSIYYIITE